MLPPKADPPPEETNISLKAFPHDNHQSARTEEKEKSDQEGQNPRTRAHFQHAQKPPQIYGVSVQAGCLHESDDHNAAQAELRGAENRPRPAHERHGGNRLYPGRRAQSPRALGGPYPRRQGEGHRRPLHNRPRHIGRGRSERAQARSEFVRREASEISVWLAIFASRGARRKNGDLRQTLPSTYFTKRFLCSRSVE